MQEQFAYNAAETRSLKGTFFLQTANLLYFRTRFSHLVAKTIDQAEITQDIAIKPNPLPKGKFLEKSLTVPSKIKGFMLGGLSEDLFLPG